MYLSYTEVERVTRRRMYYVPFIYWDWEGDKKKNVLCTFHILRVRGWQEEECIMYLSYTEGERVTRRRMYYVPFIYWGWEGDKKKNVLCTFHILRDWEGDKKKNVLSPFHILRERGWQEEECIMYLSFTEGERVTRTRMYYVSFIYWGWEGDKNKNVLCTFHILRARGWQEEECIMYLSYTEGDKRMVPFLYWGREGDKKKNVLCTFHILRVRGLQEENVLCTFPILRVRGWQEEECIMYLSYTEGERVTRRRMYYVPFIYWEGERVTRRRMYYVPVIYHRVTRRRMMYLSYTEIERVTRRRMYYVPFIYWGWEGDKNKNVVYTFHILRLRGWQEEECIISLSYTEGERVTRTTMYYVPFIYCGWEGNKKKNVLCTYHILRVRGWQEEECIMYLSYTDERVKNVLCSFHILRVRVTRTRMYYVPFLYWGREGDKKKNVLCTYHILRVRGWQEEECIMYLSYTEGERVTRRRMYYVPFIYWGWEGYKKKNVLCTFHLLRVRGWQEQECSIYLSYTEIERVTRRRMYYLPFIYWGREGDKNNNVLCTFHIGWEGQEEECIMYLITDERVTRTDYERVTRRRMYYVPFIYWDWEGDKKKNVLCTFHLLRVRGWQEQECSIYLSYTEIERVTRRRMYYLPFIYWGREGDKNNNVLCTFHILRVRG